MAMYSGNVSMQNPSNWAGTIYYYGASLSFPADLFSEVYSICIQPRTGSGLWATQIRQVNAVGVALYAISYRQESGYTSLPISALVVGKAAI